MWKATLRKAAEKHRHRDGVNSYRSRRRTHVREEVSGELPGDQDVVEVEEDGQSRVGVFKKV